MKVKDVLSAVVLITLRETVWFAVGVISRTEKKWFEAKEVVPIDKLSVASVVAWATSLPCVRETEVE